VKNSFINQFSENIKFNYTCFDRVIIRGYILKFFSLACVVLFLRAMGFSRKSNGIMRIFTDQLNSHISKQAAKHEAQIFWWPSMDGGVNGAKLRFVEKAYADKFNGRGNHVFCIITDKENVRTVAARDFVSKKGRKYQRLYQCRKPVKQYYIYVHDAVLGGPCYLKISSYLPFPCEFYFNGHNYIRHQLDQRGVSYKMKDNAFTDVSDPDALNQAAREIDGKLIQERIDYWMNLFFKFDKGKYATRSKHLQHDWYLTQVEVCSNVIFKSARFCTSLFERLLDKFARVGLPDTIAKIFSLRPARTDSKTFWRLYDNNACIKHWFRGNAIKQYNKESYLIRTETTINNPKSLGLQKPVLYLQACLWTGLGCNDRLLNCCADVDLSSICDGEADLFDQPVLDQKDRKVTAPDLRKRRQMALCRELLKPKYSVYGFKTADLKLVLNEFFSNSAQIRYEMVKLICRGVIQKKKDQSFYRVTPLGWKWLWTSICSKHYFKNPVISATFKTIPTKSSTQPYILEQGVNLINQGLSQITQGLAVNM
jgi:hypothetical protein